MYSRTESFGERVCKDGVLKKGLVLFMIIKVHGRQFVLFYRTYNKDVKLDFGIVQSVTMFKKKYQSNTFNHLN